MNKGVIAISGVVGATAALATCLVFFFFVYRPTSPMDVTPSPLPTVYSGNPTPVDEIPDPEIKPADVRSISINTVWKGFFEPGSRCAKTYNEYFGNEDGIGSISSPCTINITFNNDGQATRSIEISRWDKTAKEKRVVEKTESTGDISPEQFQTLAQAIVSNEAFRSWREGTMVTVSNCSITVNHTGGVKTIMSNVDEKANIFLQMIDAIKKLESQVKWKAES